MINLKTYIFPGTEENWVVSPSTGSIVGWTNTQVLCTCPNITVDGTRPVLLFISPDLSTNASGWSTGSTFRMGIYRGATQVARSLFNLYADSKQTPSFFMCVDNPAAGTYSYNIKSQNTTAGDYVKYCRLIAWEVGT